MGVSARAQLVGQVADEDAAEPVALDAALLPAPGASSSGVLEVVRPWRRRAPGGPRARRPPAGAPAARPGRPAPRPGGATSSIGLSRNASAPAASARSCCRRASPSARKGTCGEGLLLLEAAWRSRTPSMSGRWTSASTRSGGRVSARSMPPSPEGVSSTAKPSASRRRRTARGGRGRSRCRGCAGAWWGLPGGGDDSPALRRGLRKTTRRVKPSRRPPAPPWRASHQVAQAAGKRAFVFATGRPAPRRAGGAAPPRPPSPGFRGAPSRPCRRGPGRRPRAARRAGARPPPWPRSAGPRRPASPTAPPGAGRRPSRARGRAGARSRPTAESQRRPPAPPSPSGRPLLVEPAAPAREGDDPGRDPVGEAQLDDGLHGLLRRQHVEERGHPEQAAALPIAPPDRPLGSSRKGSDATARACRTRAGRQRGEARQHDRRGGRSPRGSRARRRRGARRAAATAPRRRARARPGATTGSAAGMASRVARGEPEAQLGDEAHGAQRAEPVLGEALARVAHRPDEPAGEVGPAAERVAQLVRERVPGHGVHGEVAPRQVGLEVVVEGDPARAAPVDVALLPAEGGHLDPRPSLDDGHGPVLDAGRDHLPEEGLHLRREWPAMATSNSPGSWRSRSRSRSRTTPPTSQARWPASAEPPEHAQHRRAGRPRPERVASRGRHLVYPKPKFAAGSSPPEPDILPGA